MGSLYFCTDMSVPMFTRRIEISIIKVQPLIGSEVVVVFFKFHHISLLSYVCRYFSLLDDYLRCCTYLESL